MMTDSEKQQVLLLKKAKHCLQREKGRYVTVGVCVLILRASRDLSQNGDIPVESEASSVLRNWIDLQLEGAGYLFHWIERNGHMSQHEIQALFDGTSQGHDLRLKLWQTRLNWIDWMIAQYPSD